MLKKYVSNPTHVLLHEPLEIREDASDVERPSRIIDTKEQELRNRTIHWVKVLWENHEPEEATWELRDQVQRKYPHLLPEVRLFLFGKIVFIWWTKYPKGWRMSDPNQD